MERTIRFRGKRTDNGEWVYGDLLQICGGSAIYFGSKTETETPDIPNDSKVAVELFDNEISVVLPVSIGQYIGIKDSNGKEIYEGDIFTVNGRYPKLVSFMENRASFCVANIDVLTQLPYIYPWQCPAEDWWKDFKREIIVIGNVFDSEYKHLQKYIKESYESILANFHKRESVQTTD